MSDAPIDSPFVVYIDSAESNPFTFSGIRADSDKQNRPINVRTAHRSLGRHPHSLGDYTADCLVGIAHVERKSMEDYWSTLLGWQTKYEAERNLVGHRDRFVKEIANLAALPAPLVFVEAPEHECRELCPSWGSKPRRENAKHLSRKLMSLLMEYRVPFVFEKNRRAAEVRTYRWLATAHRLLKEGRL